MVFSFSKSKPAKKPPEEQHAVVQDSVARDSAAEDGVAQDSVAQDITKATLALNTAAIPDARTLLTLMRKVRGQMQGNVSVRLRQHEDTGWEQMYCFIDANSGALCHQLRSISQDASSNKNGSEALVADIRSCTVLFLRDDDIDRLVIRLKPADSERDLDLFPDIESQTAHWFAALLCWQPVKQDQQIWRPSQHRCALPATPAKLGLTSSGPLRYLHAGDGFTILKEDNAFLLDYGDAEDGRLRLATSTGTRKVRCTIRVNGDFTVQSVDNNSIAITLNLGQIPRSGIRKINKNIFCRDSTLAICPQYALDLTACSRLRPLYLWFPNRSLYETWFVILWSCAIPELYISRDTSNTLYEPAYSNVNARPAQPGHSFLRIERRLKIDIRQIRLFRKARGKAPSISGQGYLEVFVDEMSADKIPIRLDCGSKVAVLGKGQFHDISALAKSLTFRMSKEYPRPSQARNGGQAHSDDRKNDQLSSFFCEGRIDTGFLESAHRSKILVSLFDQDDSEVGEVAFNWLYRRENVLPEKDYHSLYEALNQSSFTAALELLGHLSSTSPEIVENLLSIFQASGKAEDWLLALAQNELEAFVSASQIDSTLEVTGSPSARDEHLYSKLFEEPSKFFMTAKLFFRGKGTDRLMTLILEEFAGVSDDELSCEVDPDMLKNSNHVVLHWQRLTKLVDNIWTRLYRDRLELRKDMGQLFQHVNSVLQRRLIPRRSQYECLIRLLFSSYLCITTINSSGKEAWQDASILSGITTINETDLCIAVDKVNGTKKRTYILIRKCFERLANADRLNKVDCWMSPIDNYWSKQRVMLRQFIDEICNLSAERKLVGLSRHDAGTPLSSLKRQVSPLEHLDTSKDALQTTNKVHSGDLETVSYRTGSLAALTSRISPVAREGYLSLPYLLDLAREMSQLVETWLHYHETILKHDSKGSTMSSELKIFHRNCLKVKDMAMTRSASLELATDPDHGEMQVIQQQWVSLAESFEANPAKFWQPPLGKKKETRNDSFSIRSAQTRGGTQESSAGSIVAVKTKSSRASGSQPSRHSADSRADSYRPSRVTQDNAMRKLGWL